MEKPRTFTMDEILKLAPLGGAHLPAPLRGRLVNRGPWIGYSFSAPAKAGETDL